MKSVCRQVQCSFSSLCTVGQMYDSINSKHIRRDVLTYVHVLFCVDKTCMCMWPVDLLIYKVCWLL